MTVDNVANKDNRPFYLLEEATLTPTELSNAVLVGIAVEAARDKALRVGIAQGGRWEWERLGLLLKRCLQALEKVQQGESNYVDIQRLLTDIKWELRP